MAYTDWELKMREFGNCNCAFGCPCQFMAMPTDGTCRAIVGFLIDEGHFGETRLDGLRAVLILKWPGAIHEGNGAMQLIIDKRADDAQRKAVRKIFNGEDTEPGTTFFNVFTATYGTVHDPLYRDIQFEVDIEARTAKLVVEGLVESAGEPIRNPVTGEEVRVRIDMPDGFEYTLAEMGSGTSNATGSIPMELTASYGQFANMHMGTQGVLS